MELGWVDFSSEDRKKLQQILGWLDDEKNAIDRLGFGVLRDAIADRLFPTTSTLHTRARYLFLISYDLRDLERSVSSGGKKTTARNLREQYKKKEIKRKRALKKACEEAGVSTEGIIGINQTGERWLAQPPIDMYWSAIRELGLLDTTVCGGGLQSHYFKYLVSKAVQASNNTGLEKQERLDEGATERDELVAASCWRNVPSKEPEACSFDLTKEEALILRNAIIERWNDSFYAFLLQASKNNPFLKAVLGGAEIQDIGNLATQGVLPSKYERIKTDLEMADSFSSLVYGCYIRFNLQTLELAGKDCAEQNKKWNDYIRSEEAKRTTRFDAMDYFQHFSVENTQAAVLLQRFCNDAILCMRECIAHPRSKEPVKKLDEAILNQELNKKHNLAILYGLQKGHMKYSNDMQQSEDHMQFRLKEGRMMVSDIRDGLARGNG